jgi:hypothetical protein
LLQHLWDGLKNEPRVHLRKQVTSVVHPDSGVIVKCHDGSEFAGDIVIGADGVRSGIRKEMRRYMSEHGHVQLLSKDELSTCIGLLTSFVILVIAFILPVMSIALVSILSATLQIIQHSR